MDYFVSLGKKYNIYLMYEKRVAFYTLDELRRLAHTYNQPELKKEMEQKLQEYASALNIGDVRQVMNLVRIPRIS